MRRAPLLLIVPALLASACSDDLAGPGAPVLESRCGVDGPLQVIALDPGRPVDFVDLEVIADRLLYRIGMDDDSEQLWSVGRCGEDPVLLLDGELDPFATMQLGSSPWPELRFACPAGSHTRVAIDPQGLRPSHATFAAGNCVVLPSADGLVTVLGEGDAGTLLFQPWPSDPFTQAAEQIVLLDGVRTSPHPFEPSKGAGVVYAATADEALAVSADGELLSVRLDDLTIEALSEEVLSFTASRDGRWIMYESLSGGLYLLNRDADASMYLADTPLAELSVSDPMRFASIGLLYYAVHTNGETEHHYLRIPELSEFVAPADPLTVIDETRGLIGWLPLAVLDVGTGDSAPIPGLPEFGSRSLGDTGITVLESDGRLELYNFDGKRELLANSASDGWTRADNGQIFTLADQATETDDRGPLVAVDPETLGERYVDDDVLRWSLAAFVEDESGVISYALADPERYGVWLAQPDLSSP